MILGRWSVCLLLPLVVLLERFAYYSTRSVLFVEFASVTNHEEAFARLTTISWLLLSTPPLGGLLALALKPRWTLVAGLAVAAAGYAALAAAGAQSMAAFGVLAVGLGLVRPALYATAALALRDPLESGRGALLIGAYLATNAGAFAGQLVGSALQGRSYGQGDTFTFLSGIGAAGLVVATLLAFAIAIAPRLDPVREPADPPFTGRGELGAVLVMVLALPLSVLMESSAVLQYDLFYRLPEPAPAWLNYVNPSVVIAVGTLLLAVLGAAAYVGKRIRSLYLAGAGVMLAALAAVPLLALASGEPGMAKAGSLASITLMAAAEVLCFPFVLSRIAAGPHPRTATLVVGFWLFLLAGFPQAIRFVQERLLEGGQETGPVAGILTVTTAVLALVTGAGVIAVQYFAGSRIWPDAEETAPRGDAELAPQT